MEFNSASFLFAFLPLLLIVYHLIPGTRGKNACLICASLLFYAFGDLRYLPLLLGSVILHYAVGLLLMRPVRGKRVILAVCVTLDVASLLIFKLSGVLPLGVSFFTFQAISYVVDVYRDRENGSRSFFEVLQYITFFPQIVSGPLMKFSEIRPYFTCRTATAAQTASGLRRFTVGLAKKLLLSSAAAGLANAVFSLAPGTLDIRAAWLGAVCYSLQLYFDFSGYSDMAVGLGRLFGFALPENFRYPYCASSVTDFWRRWHISLSAWFRDYLYIPLGGNRKGKLRTVCNKLVVFFATGLWHGASLNFILWGLWHGAFSAFETCTGAAKKLQKRWYGHVYALLVAVLGFVIFRASSAAQAGQMFAAMFTGFRLTYESGAIFTHLIGAKELALLLLGCVLCTPVAPKLQLALTKRGIYEPASLFLTLALFALCVLAMASGSFQPFIYAQF